MNADSLLGVPYRRTAHIQQRIDAQRVTILRAAADLLAEGGYAACGIAAVAQRAGVAAGTVYNHFDNKTGLLTELFHAVVGREVDAVRAATASTGASGAASGDALDQVQAVIETFAGRALKSPRRAYALLAEPVDPAVDALRLQFRRAFRDIFAAAVATGVRSGELPPQDAEVVAAALVGAVAEALTGPLSTGVEQPDTVPALIGFAQRAIGGRP